MFTPNTRDEVMLIYLKHKFTENDILLKYSGISLDFKRLADAENVAIRRTFEEVMEKNSRGIQDGTYEAIGKICEEFFESIEEKVG